MNEGTTKEIVAALACAASELKEVLFNRIQFERDHPSCPKLRVPTRQCENFVLRFEGEHYCLRAATPHSPPIIWIYKTAVSFGSQLENGSLTHRSCANAIRMIRSAARWERDRLDGLKRAIQKMDGPNIALVRACAFAQALKQ